MEGHNFVQWLERAYCAWRYSETGSLAAALTQKGAASERLPAGAQHASRRSAAEAADRTQTKQWCFCPVRHPSRPAILIRPSHPIKHERRRQCQRINYIYITTIHLIMTYRGLLVVEQTSHTWGSDGRARTSSRSEECQGRWQARSMFMSAQKSSPETGLLGLSSEGFRYSG